MGKEGTMRRHLPIALASAVLLAGAATGMAQAAPGAKGPRGGDAKALPGFVKKGEGEKQAAVLKAEGARTSASLRAEGESKAIETVFQAIHDGAPDERLLSYQYLQMLPQLAQGSANKLFIIPSEFNQALGNLGNAISGMTGGGPPPKPKARRPW